MLENISLTEAAPLSIGSLLLNLAVGAILSLVLKIHFKKFGSTLSNREEFGNIFPFILLTTVLVISIVKSSLALSLGLVGALSIVRFRTPIKEPEELAYLFIAIAIGLGLGANQTMPTIASSIFILLVMSILKFANKKSKEKNMFLTIDYKPGTKLNKEDIVQKLNHVIGEEVNRSDLRRLDIRENSVEATYLISIMNIKMLEQVIQKLEKIYPGITITYLDQSQMPSI